MTTQNKTPLLFALLLAAALSACSRGGSDPSANGETGRAAFPLSATSTSGKVYRLRGAVIDVQGAQTMEIEGPVDPTDPQITTTASLPPGTYEFRLRDGWTMYQVPADGVPVPVPAQLTGPNPITVEIASGQDAAVTFHFVVGGEMIPPGSATVGIDVNEPDGGLTPPELPVPAGGLAPPELPVPEASDVPVIIPENVRVADDVTRAALAEYSPATGTLRFSRSTALLEGLAPGAVLVSEPSAAAPAGYLRKVISVRIEGEEVFVETSQANLTDAITQGTLPARVPSLGRENLLTIEYAMEGVSIEPVPADAAPVPGGDDGVGEELLAFGVGNSYDYEVKIDHTFLPLSGSGAGQVKVEGSVKFNVGYGIDLSIRPCLTIVCLKSFQAYVGFNQSASLKVTGTASGLLGGDVLIATQYYKPQVFSIGPVPVVVVPTLSLYLTAGGQVEATIAFEANENVTARIGAAWTHDDDWQDISNFGASAGVAASFTGAIKPRVVAKSAMSLKLYGIAGPELSLHAGLELDGRIPRNPKWIATAILTGKLTFKVELPIIGTIADTGETTLFDLSLEVDRSENTPPRLEMTARSMRDPEGRAFMVGEVGGLPWVELRETVDFTPGCKGSLAAGIYFATHDDEDGCLRVMITSDRDGVIPYKHAFDSVGKRLLTVTTTDSQGASVSERFLLNVVNSHPTITLERQPAGIYKGSPVTIKAVITDPNEDGVGLCANTDWTVAEPDKRIPSNCLATVTFGETGVRQVTVSVHDREGAYTTATLTVTVLPTPENLNPILNGATVYQRDYPGANIDLCGPRAIAANSTIDLTAPGCDSPNAYFVEANVLNPNGEPLTYEWKLRTTTGGPLTSQTSASPRFELPRLPGGVVTTTVGCQVELIVHAPEVSRTKGPLVVWDGQCTYAVGLR